MRRHPLTVRETKKGTGYFSSISLGDTKRKVACPLWQDPRGGGLVLAVEFLAELDELALEGLEAVGDRVGHVGVIHRRLGQPLPPFRLDDPGRHADDRGVRRDRLQYDGVGSDLDVIADLDPTEDLGPGAHHHVIAQRWMAPAPRSDRKSTRLNSSHGYISYAVFCLEKKKQNNTMLN